MIREALCFQIKSRQCAKGHWFYVYSQSKAPPKFLRHRGGQSLGLRILGFDANLDLIQLFPTVDIRSELSDICVASNDIFHCTWEYVDPAHNEDVVDPAYNTTLERDEGSPTFARLRR